MERVKVNRRLVIFPAPFQGHVTPMIHLANLLYSKGFSISLIQTTYNPISPTNYPHFTFHFLDDGLVEKYTKCPPPDSFQVLPDMNAGCPEPFRDCLSQVLNDAAVTDQEPVACLITDPMWRFAGSVAADLNVPIMALRTGSMSAYLVYDSLPLLHEKGYFSLKESKPDQPVLEFPPLKVKDLPAKELHELLTVVMKETKTSKGMICNTFEELEGYSIDRVHKILPIPIFPVGPMHKHLPTSGVCIWTEDQTSIAWLNSQEPKSVLYVSFGSVASVNNAEFLEIAWGLANSMLPFLWVVRPGLIQGSEENSLISEDYMDTVKGRGHIVKWAPQLEVLAHPAVGGFWTHSGWNSTMESICEGVPMLCLPIFGDQYMNARHVCDNWRVGIQLEKGMKREEIKTAVRKLMVEQEGEEIRNRITTLKEKAKLCVMDGHSSYKSLEKLVNYLLVL